MQQGNVFTCVCHHVHRGMSGRHNPWQTPPDRQTPPWQADNPDRQTPPGRHLPWQTDTSWQVDTLLASIHPLAGRTHLPQRWPLQRTVRILLECILVIEHVSWGVRFGLFRTSVPPMLTFKLLPESFGMLTPLLSYSGRPTLTHLWRSSCLIIIRFATTSSYLQLTNVSKRHSYWYKSSRTLFAGG